MPPALPGLGLEDIRLAAAAGGIAVQAHFVNGDQAASATFVPLAVLSDEQGHELQEVSGAALQLNAQERRLLRLQLPLNGQPAGRYYVSVRPSDPQSGRPLGRGHYRMPVDVPAPAAGAVR
jgi:hypothetical protein